MTLSSEDSLLFYRLWFQLLDYTNRKYKISPKIKSFPIGGHLDPAEVHKVANAIWDDGSIIDAFIADCSEKLENAHIEIIRGWKRRIHDRFILERHLQNGSIFISTTDQQVYQVKGLQSSWPEMLHNAPLPLILDATVIPFKDVLITDGLIVPYQIYIGHNMAEELKDIYRAAKKNGAIHRTI